LTLIKVRQTIGGVLEQMSREWSDWRALRADCRPGVGASLQRGQSRRCYHRGIIPHLDETQIYQRPKIVVLDRRQFKPVTKDVAKGPAEGDGIFEVKVCKRSFRHGLGIDDLPIGSAEGRVSVKELPSVCSLQQRRPA
jgi:hypothetical protein